MAKDNERQIAYTLYTEKCLTAKEIAQKLKITEKTVGKWVEDGNWKDIRMSKQTSPDMLVSKNKELLEMLLDKRIKLEKINQKTEEQRDEMRNIIDEMSKISAMIDRLQDSGKISLRVHIVCLEKFSAAMQMRNPKLFKDIIDFQKEYLMLLAEELK
ncbi:MAG: phage terminase small subunit-related protein [Bacteroidia bacterium]|nr:phage terminase small subunit-related protein [Bacteroidia bacterium]